MTLLLKIAIIIANIIYLPLKCLPIKKKITFISRQSDTPSMDFTMLCEEINHLYPDFQTVLLCKTIRKGIVAKVRYLFHMVHQMIHLATSQIIILDSYSILISVLHHRKSLLVVQIWHSVGTMKKFGYSILDMPEGSSSKLAHTMKMHAHYDYILAASDAYKPHLAEGFQYPVSRIKTYPLPRVELLKSKAYATKIKNKIYTKYPQLEQKETILYVPTFRKGEDANFSKAVSALADAIDYDRYNLVIKTHPLANIYLVHPLALIDHDFSSFDMLFISNHVISDFSCIIYEAAILKRPIYLYTYDYNHYLSTRDIYIDYKKEMPGPICSTAAEIFQAIDQQACDLDQVARFASKYVTPRSSHETKDIVDFIFSNKKI